MQSQDHDEIKTKLPQILLDCGGIVSAACKKVNIPPDDFHKWLKSDNAFAKKIAAVRDAIDDFYESEFIKLVKAGNATAIMYAAKTRLKHRGYGAEVAYNYGNKFVIAGNTSSSKDLTGEQSALLEGYVQQRIRQHKAALKIAKPEAVEVPSEQ